MASGESKNSILGPYGLGRGRGRGRVITVPVKPDLGRRSSREDSVSVTSSTVDESDEEFYKFLRKKKIDLADRANLRSGNEERVKVALAKKPEDSVSVTSSTVDESEEEFCKFLRQKKIGLADKGNLRSGNERVKAPVAKKAADSVSLTSSTVDESDEEFLKFLRQKKTGLADRGKYKAPEEDFDTDTETITSVYTDTDTDAEREIKNRPAEKTILLSSASKEALAACNLRSKVEQKRAYLAHEPGLCIPEIPYADSSKLVFSDVQYQAEQAFGTFDSKPTEDYRPKFPTQISWQNDCFVVTPVEGRSELGKIELPRNHKMLVTILCIDTEDIIHCKVFDDRTQLETVRTDKEIRIASLSSLLKELDTHYDNVRNQKKTRYSGEDGNVPTEGEVVVVRMIRCIFNDEREVRREGYNAKKEYQRARVVELKNNMVVEVDLLDDYGKGCVPIQNVFRIKKVFTEFPPQLFSCELGGIGFFDGLKVVHKLMRTCPIPRTWGECSLNKVQLTFKGQYSKKNLPVVELDIRVISSFPTRWMSLTSYVLKNIGSVISPLGHLLDNSGGAIGHVLRADVNGNIWVLFKKDHHILEKLEDALEHLKPMYEDRVAYLPLRVKELIRLKKEEIERNLSKVYVALFKRYETDEKEMLYRVKITGNIKGTNELLVFCLDYATQHFVDASKLLSLAAIDQELCDLPPLALELRLNGIASLDVSSDLVIASLFNDEVRVSLVTEWPGHFKAPEVNVFLNDDNSGRESEPLSVHQITGMAKLFVQEKLAEELPKEVWDYFYEKARGRMKTNEESEVAERKYAEEYGPGCQFLGENFQFLAISTAASIIGD